ncbi:PTS sugar transporter subunit IIC [Carnobacterium pleistocenium]|uniref:PTS sugar transporter subunit IIC n=1 Tax=Carnobacterium pleistocenium TaxID=181073 RepID=UPI0005517D00|nr:PTS sugar transporter subunit IIC [Carnobacterium pleistocenium]
MKKETFTDRLYKASQGIAAAVVVTLGIGLLIQSIGELLGLTTLVTIGAITKTLLIPGLGIGISYYLKTDILTMLSATAAGVIGGRAYILTDGVLSLKSGEPVGALVAIAIAIVVGTFLFNKTRFNMILVPFVSILISGIAGYALSSPIAFILTSVSSLITSSVAGFPLLSSMVLGLVFGMLILSPASSAAVALALQLDGSAGAAALIGCSVQFTVFAFLSLKDNDAGTFLGHLIITPKLQTGNIIKHPKVALFPLLLGTILAPVGVLVFNLEASAEIAGMGLCALVSVFGIASSQGLPATFSYLFVVIILPGLLSILFKPFLIKSNLLKPNELKVTI